MAAAVGVLPPTTPPDYHQIVSPTLRIPTDVSVTIPVGLLTCQRDPLLRTLDTSVISTAFVKPSTPADAGKKKGHAKQAKASAPPPLLQPFLQVIVHDTILFPEGGGQSHDIGQLTTEDGKVWDVEIVKRHGGVAVHYLKAPEGMKDVPAVLTAGKKVHLALGEEGFKRRLDHMSMHTAQHLLSARIETRLSLSTLAWSLSAWPSPAYIDLPRALTAGETALIQEDTNRLAFEGRRVYIEVQELHAGEPGSDGGNGASARELGRGLPKDYTGGVHRIVVIDGIDRNPCCGTHLPSLASLQLFVFPPPPSSSSGPVRHYFLAGPRLLNHLGTVQSLLTRTVSALSCGAPETPDRVALIVDESKKREKRIDEVERELAEYIGARLFEEMVQWRKDGGEGEWTKYVARTDDGPTALMLLQAITIAFAAHASKLSESGDAPRYTLLLTSSPSSQNSVSTTVIALFGSDDKRVKEVGEELKKQFKSLKGGGRGLRWTGKSIGVWLADREGKTVSLALTQPSAA